MKIMKLGGIVLGSILAVNAFAADVTGKWNGTIDVDMSKAMAAAKAQMAKATPEQKKQFEAGMKMASEMLKNARFNMTINKDGTYIMKTPAMMQTPAKEEKGTWKMAGNKITLNDPNPKTQMKQLTGTVSADGKTIVFDVSAQAKAAAKSQGSKQEVPKTVMTFKKA
jgi:hypothetical protein